MSGQEPAVGRVRRAREPMPRSVVQKVKLTEVERGQLRACAAELGVTVPRLLVESALTGRESSTQRRTALAQLFETRRLLATVANNVNQLAKAANISGQVEESARLAATLGEVREVLGELQQLTRALR